LVLARPIGR